MPGTLLPSVVHPADTPHTVTTYQASISKYKRLVFLEPWTEILASSSVGFNFQ